MSSILTVGTISWKYLLCIFQCCTTFLSGKFIWFLHMYYSACANLKILYLARKRSKIFETFVHFILLSILGVRWTFRVSTTIIFGFMAYIRKTKHTTVKSIYSSFHSESKIKKFTFWNSNLDVGRYLFNAFLWVFLWKICRKTTKCLKLFNIDFPLSMLYRNN